MSRYIDVDDALEVLTLMYDNQADKDDPYNVGVKERASDEVLGLRIL